MFYPVKEEASKYYETNVDVWAKHLDGYQN